MGVLSNGEMLLMWPLEKHIITAGFYYSDGSKHSAIDLRDQWDGHSGKPVTPALKGKVTEIGHWDGHSKTGMQSYGNYVLITHDNYNGKSLKTRYAHLSAIGACVGDSVDINTVIGKTGSTGNCYGSHLHFEVIYDGSRRNPLVWLDDDFTVVNSNVFTFSAGEHSVVVPKGKTQTISIKNLPNRVAYLIYDTVKERGVESSYIASYADQFQRTQNITLSEISDSDAMAIWGICVNTGYGDNYTSEYD